VFNEYIPRYKNSKGFFKEAFVVYLQKKDTILLFLFSPQQSFSDPLESN
jgi:hypothetical protein